MENNPPHRPGQPFAPVPQPVRRKPNPVVTWVMAFVPVVFGACLMCFDPEGGNDILYLFAAVNVVCSFKVAYDLNWNHESRIAAWALIIGAGSLFFVVNCTVVFAVGGLYYLTHLRC